MQRTGADLDNRDPNHLNAHVQVLLECKTEKRNSASQCEHGQPMEQNEVNFDDVFGEPEGVQSADCVWRNAYNCFECGKNCCYKLMTLLCGICIALEWGCEFAILSFNHVWCWTPLIRDFSISMGCCAKFYRIILDACCAPCFEAMGACFSRIKISRS